MPDRGRYAQLSEVAEARFEALCAIRGRLRRTHRQALDGTAHALRPGSMDPAIPARRLVYLDLSAREPLAAIVVGDLDTATHVTWQLSGTGIRARNALWGSAREAGQLYLEQRNAGIESPAVVAWLGYRSPNLASALVNRSARRGVKVLARDLEVFATLRRDKPHLAIEAHSYAASLAAQALDAGAGSRVHIQALATIGSAGIPGKLSRDPARLNIPPGRIYEAVAEGDHLARWGRLLSGRKTLAGRSFSVAARPDLGLLGIRGHNTSHMDRGDAAAPRGYRDPGTTSLRNLALITTGQEPLP
ncbi:alpha/beta hydrolase [Paeniglutamicibacter sp. R2-26]|uniref:alpha/beta hydrolase n=1 Tax=Paeniglutamicibacter sp. R2-26 TaxID=3144417 RepID=UPI003EE5088C